MRFDVNIAVNNSSIQLDAVGKAIASGMILLSCYACVETDWNA